MLENNRSKIEDMKRNLYDPNNKSIDQRREGVLHQVHHDTPLEWKNDKVNEKDNMKDKDKYKKPPVSIFKKFFLGALIFFVGALAFAFYKFSSDDSSVSNDKIDIEVIGNSFTKGGDELPLQIEITNNNNANLELANLIIEYPKGAEDIATDVVRLPRDSVGTIKAGESIIRNINVKLFGEEKSIRNIKISLEYHPQSSNAIFTKDKYYPVTISLSPLSINIEAPTNTTSNQEISLKIKTVLNTSLSGDNPILQVKYPNNFIFESATPSPIVSNSIWDLSSISIENPINIEIRGRLIGEDGDEQVFRAYAGTTNGMNQSSVNVVYSSILQKIAISKPFLDARILVNGQDKKEYVVKGGQEVNVEIAWSNNLSTRITDGQIAVSLSGNVFDKNNVKSNNGFYDSLNSKIIWDRNSVQKLSEINPGENGTVSFSFKPYSLIGLSDIKDPQVSISVSIKGRQPQLGSTYDDIDNFSEKIVKLSSDFQIASSADYFSGSIPPKAETDTSYRVIWTLSNSANSINKAEARSALPIYVEWVGISQGVDDSLTYNEVTREVIWNIGQVDPNTGINSNREVSFIVSIKPSLNQVGSVPQLMREIYLSGIDSFTNTNIKSTHSSITTSISSNNGRVVQ
jgi:hypothetical protein